MVILLTRASQKLTSQQNRLRRNWVPEQLSGLLTHATGSHPGFSDLWKSPPVLSSTLVTFGCVVFLIVQASSFFIHSPFLTQSIRLPLVTYPSLFSTFVTYGTLCYGSGHQMLSTQPLPREAESFPKRCHAF